MKTKNEIHVESWGVCGYGQNSGKTPLNYEKHIWVRENWLTVIEIEELTVENSREKA